MRAHAALCLATAMGTSCATPTPVAVPAPADVAVHTPDADPARLCQVKAEIDGATSRLALAELRERLARAALPPAEAPVAPGDGAARFGALLSKSDEAERLEAFRDDAEKNPTSAVGPLGACFVYAAKKMADQASTVCQEADDRLAGAAIVDVARAELNRRRGQLEEAQALIDNALSVDNGCSAALIEGARVSQARGELVSALALWERARASWPSCFLCAVEAAQLTEVISTRAAAVPLWEAALALAPDAPDALKRYGAVLAGVDDKRALGAYEKALAAGVSDVATLIGAAQLASAAGEIDKALGFAERAAQIQKNDVDAWRLTLSLAQERRDGARALTAAHEILRLVDEDVTALVVLARDARAQDKLVDAVVRYDAASRAIVAGRATPFHKADVAAVMTEHKRLLKDLKVPAKPAKGSASSVVAQLKSSVQALFVERLKKKKLKGNIEVAVTVSPTGAIDAVDIVKDSLDDVAITAAIVATLRRAHIVGGAGRTSFQLEFM
jgi:tetratricopeptide (TPR) repeat protein